MGRDTFTWESFSHVWEIKIFLWCRKKKKTLLTNSLFNFLSRLMVILSHSSTYKTFFFYPPNSYFWSLVTQWFACHTKEGGDRRSYETRLHYGPLPVIPCLSRDSLREIKTELLVFSFEGNSFENFFSLFNLVRDQTSEW